MAASISPVLPGAAFEMENDDRKIIGGCQPGFSAVMVVERAGGSWIHIIGYRFWRR